MMPRGRVLAILQGILAVGIVTAATVAPVVWLDGRHRVRVIGTAEASSAPHDEESTWDEPIAAEAGVFRIRPGDLAAENAARRPTAHPRNLATFRANRAYPGAPPRIPHGLTVEESRGSRCNTCHERGGYVSRFEAYAPITPHPERIDCQQCHTADAALVGLDVPRGSPDYACRQCHAAGGRARDAIALDWRPLAWPRSARSSLHDEPPPIPHDLQMRENCLACHMGLGAAEEIRTTHPERADCRGCHLQLEPEGDAVNRDHEGMR